MERKLMTASVLMGLLIVSVPVFAEEKNEKERSEKQEAAKEKNNFYGYVEKMPSGETGTWVVDGRNVNVDDETELEGKIKQGSYVKVKGKFKGKTFTAYEIELRKDKKKNKKEEK